MAVFWAGFVYFALVFAAGFALGPLRVLALEPHIGAVAAVAIETPFLLVAIFFAARWTVKRFAIPPVTSSRLAMGVLALALQQGADILVALGLRNMTVLDHIEAFRTPQGLIYAGALAVFTLMPLVVRR